MALLQSGGLTDLTRQMMRLSILTGGYASSIVSPLALSHSQALQLGGVRLKFTKRANYKVTRKIYKDDESAVHCHGFTYFPRFPGQKDPPITPAKLFRVQRVLSLFGCPHWERKLMRNLGLENKSDIVIFKNTPETNKLLYKLKHLIEIQPITTPYGMPDSPENGYLKPNGELIAYNTLKLYGEDATVEKGEKILEEYRANHIGGETLKKRLNANWYGRHDAFN